MHSETSQQSNKNYLNYINFQNNPSYKTSLRDIPREPEQAATYSINLQHSEGSHPINRNPYLSPNVEPRQSEKAFRNSANKESVVSRQSQ